MVDISELTESVKGYIEGLQAVLQRKYQISEEKALNMITSSYIEEYYETNYYSFRVVRK